MTKFFMEMDGVTYEGKRNKDGDITLLVDGQPYEMNEMSTALLGIALMNLADAEEDE